jgi:hypothetical protein
VRFPFGYRLFFGFARGAEKKKKATYIWQMINQVGRYLLFFLVFLFEIFYGVFVRFSTRGVQKHHKKLFGESPVKNFGPKKLRENKLFFLRLFPSIFFIAFLAVSLHEEPKNTIKIFSKIRPENLKKTQKSR